MNPHGVTRGGSILKVVVLIDGGHLRAFARKDGHTYNPDFIEKVAHSCLDGDENLLRVLYYDCAPFQGETKLPVSGKPHTFSGSDKWLEELAAKNLFAVRRGVLKFRGFKPKKIPIAPITALTDTDFGPDFEQKGVDMRIGLDMANYSKEKSVDRIILLTNDTDCLPAMKHCRTAGLQIVLVSVPKQKVPPELLWHSDFERPIKWP